MVYRMFCLQSHYRKPLEFSYEVMDNVSVSYNKLLKKIAELKEDGDVSQDKFDEYNTKFCEALENDLNTSMAITCVYDVLRADMNDATKRALIEKFDYVLSLNLMAGCTDASDDVDDQLTAYVDAMIEERKATKKEKNFQRADEIRNELLAKGIVIEDTREGVRWRRQ